MSDIWRLFGRACKTKGYLRTFPLTEPELDNQLRVPAQGHPGYYLTHTEYDALKTMLNSEPTLKAFDDIADTGFFATATDEFCRVIGLICTDSKMKKAIRVSNAKTVVITDCKFGIAEADAGIIDNALRDVKVSDAMKTLGEDGWIPPDCETNYFSRAHVGTWRNIPGGAKSLP